VRSKVRVTPWRSCQCSSSPSFFELSPHTLPGTTTRDAAYHQILDIPRVIRIADENEWDVTCRWAPDLPPLSLIRLSRQSALFHVMSLIARFGALRSLKGSQSARHIFMGMTCIDVPGQPRKWNYDDTQRLILKRSHRLHVIVVQRHPTPHITHEPGSRLHRQKEQAVRIHTFWTRIRQFVL
jgi:hypothetical protein